MATLERVARDNGKPMPAGKLAGVVAEVCVCLCVCVCVCVCLPATSHLFSCINVSFYRVCYISAACCMTFCAVFVLVSSQKQQFAC